MLLEGKRILVTGITNESSLAFPVARIAQEQGAEVVLSSFGRVMSITRRAARRLPTEPEIVELDVSNQEDLDALAANLGGRLDGVVHSIAYAPAVVPRRRVPRRSVGGRRGRAAGVGLFLEGARGRGAAPHAERRLDRGLRLRQHPRLPRLRLDGRREVGARSRCRASSPATSVRRASG